jgi:hypothetical protein
VRLPDWLTRLSAYIDAVRRLPFEAGRHDCALFAAGAVAAMTGNDPAEAYRGRYATTQDGLALLRASGSGDHVERAVELFPMQHPSRGQTGDIAIFDVETGLALGVVVGPRVFLVGPGGLYTADLMAARKVLKV